MVTEAARPFGLSLNREQAALLLKGLKSLPGTDQNNVIYEALIKDIECILTIWDRRIKNEKILQEQRRKLKQQKSQSAKSAPPPSAPAPKRP